MKKQMTKKLSVFIIGAMMFSGAVHAQWTKTGNKVRLTTNTDSVGIGTTTPGYKLHVVGATRIQGATAIVGATTVTGKTTTTTFRMTTTPTNNYVMKSDASGNGSWVNISTLETDPQVGANTTNYVSKWNGSALVTSSIFDNGKVGIGVSAPSAKLEISSGANSQVFDELRFKGGYFGGESHDITGWDGSNIIGRMGIAWDGAYGKVNFGDLYGSARGTLMSLSGAGLSNGTVNINGLAHITENHTAPDFTNCELELEAPVSSTYYPALSLIYNGDGNQIYGTTSAGSGVLIYNAAGTAYSPISASAFQVNSDRTLKKDIVEVGTKDYSDYLNQIRNIESITYRYKNEVTSADASDPTAPVREFPHVGFTAQTLPSAVQCKMLASPKIGAETKLGYNLSDMAGLTLIGVKAVDAKSQELEKQVKDLSDQVKSLETALSQCCSSYSPSKSGAANSTLADKASLEQNAPNPFSSETSIRYYLPSNSTAILKVMSLDGKEMMTTSVSKTGYGEIRISGNTLAAGTYTYSLLVDGKALDSKIMVLTK